MLSLFGECLAFFFMLSILSVDKLKRLCGRYWDLNFLVTLNGSTDIDEHIRVLGSDDPGVA